ncbi:MAG: hypothetical protein F4X72_05910 [Dehalococcoidia bacterium]|nr:hypothetical protein [Dehalococcoidia bacterium]
MPLSRTGIVAVAAFVVLVGGLGFFAVSGDPLAPPPPPTATPIPPTPTHTPQEALQHAFNLDVAEWYGCDRLLREVTKARYFRPSRGLQQQAIDTFTPLVHGRLKTANRDASYHYGEVDLRLAIAYCVDVENWEQ